MKKAVIAVLTVILAAVLALCVPAAVILAPVEETPYLTSTDSLSTCESASAEDAPYGTLDPLPTKITLSFIGDCMLATDRGGEYPGSFNHLAKQVPPSYFFEEFKELFSNDDWTVANLENVFTDNPDAAVRNKNHSPAYWYKSTAANTAILTEGSIEIVSLANNHSEDYGNIGHIDTRAALDEAGIIWGDNEKVLILEKEGYKIALYCVTYWYSGYERAIINEMNKVEADYKIVYFHGGTERVHVPDPWKAEGARRMIDSGIDSVIGGHPHVLQPIEVYNGKTIVHSLGNFVFGGSRREENRTIVYRLNLTFTEGELTGVSDEVIPCYVYTELYKPGIIKDADEIAAVMSFLAGESESPLG